MALTNPKTLSGKVPFSLEPDKLTSKQAAAATSATTDTTAG